MTIKSYLCKVRRKLNLPKQWRDRVISDLESSIAARLENGISQEEILRELGSPAKTASEFNEQMKEHSYRKSPWRFLCLAAAILSAISLGWSLWLYSLLDGLFDGHGHSFGVIGGADGPTAIMVTHGGLSFIDIAPFLFVILLGLGGYFLLRRCKNRK